MVCPLCVCSLQCGRRTPLRRFLVFQCPAIVIAARSAPPTFVRSLPNANFTVMGLTHEIIITEHYWNCPETGQRRNPIDFS
jgi:hypothetical protein